MTIDLSPSILEAASQREGWSERALESAIGRVLELDSGVRIDWDPEAGEHWASLLGEQGVVGFLHTDIPLGIFIGGTGEEIARDLSTRGLTTLVVDGYDEPVYRVSRAAMSAAFPYAPLSEEWSGDGVSIHDLWYETVT